MAKIVWTEPALQDLEQIAEYISLDKPDAAKRFVRQVFDRVEQLTSHPKSGSVPPELKGTPYRHLVHPPVRIFYRIQLETIFVVYIMRGERLFQQEDLRTRDDN